MTYIINDQFDIGEDRSVLLVQSDSIGAFPLGEYLIRSEEFEDMYVTIDGRRLDSNDKSGKSHLVTTTQKVNLKEMLHNGVVCRLISL